MGHDIKRTQIGVANETNKEETWKEEARERVSRKTLKLRPYMPPKTAAELDITCATLVNGEKYGKAVSWFDYALGERSHIRGFVSDEHRVSKRLEKLARKGQHLATSASKGGPQ